MVQQWQPLVKGWSILAMHCGHWRWPMKAWSSANRHWIAASHWMDFGKQPIPLSRIDFQLCIFYIPLWLRCRRFDRHMTERATFQYMLAPDRNPSIISIPRNLSLHSGSGHISSHSCRGCLLNFLCSAISLTFRV